jgi:ketosteroid isomerase-like protein
VAAEDTESVVRAYIEACNDDDIERVLELLDPAIEIHEATTLPGAVSAVGFDAAKRYLERFGTHWSSFHWEPLEWRAQGERVLMRARLSLKGRESGIDVDREWWYVFTTREGRLLRQEGFDDRDSAVSALTAG